MSQRPAAATGSDAELMLSVRNCNLHSYDNKRKDIEFKVCVQTVDLDCV